MTPKSVLNLIAVILFVIAAIVALGTPIAFAAAVWLAAGLAFHAASDLVV